MIDLNVDEHTLIIYVTKIDVIKGASSNQSAPRGHSVRLTKNYKILREGGKGLVKYHV